ncbi:zinc ABC transporter permease [Vibrio alginolyticus]|nr:zinc ABC transporter permease [Vibrio alginolyticus]BCB46515.1 zinc ABC transporter permease [Vibrio alginolyticus]BCB51116.1 zinc ABC transporter permease [Vibrio alginolyticus]BCB55719.1 zinc ABC transporter permease [Vibrio alginolyticus]
MKLLIASTWFQLCWFSAVLGTYQWQWLTLTLTFLTLVYCWRTDAFALKHIASIVLAGVVLDTLNQQFSVFVFPTQWLPIWLLCLWVLFSWYAYQLKSVLYRFSKIYVSIVGGVGGTVSYYAGYKLQVVEYGFNTSVTLVILFAEWFAMTLLILKVYGYEKLEERFNPEAD